MLVRRRVQRPRTPGRRQTVAVHGLHRLQAGAGSGLGSRTALDEAEGTRHGAACPVWTRPGAGAEQHLVALALAGPGLPLVASKLLENGAESAGSGRVAAPQPEDAPMKTLAVSLALMMVAGSALACPGAGGKAMDAKVDHSPTVTAALAEQAKQQTKTPAMATAAEKKAAKPAEAKRPTS